MSKIPRDQIHISKLNSATVFVDAHPGILAEMEEWFKALAPNHRFDPRFKANYWDGYIYNFSHATQHLAIGLLCEVQEFARRGGYTITADFDLKPLPVDLKKFIKFVDYLDIRLPEGKKPRPYQLASVWDAITKKRLNIEVPTSGGKTLISYLMVRWFQGLGLKTLLVVPTTTLVEQTYGDWFDFGWDSIRDNVHKVYGETEKYFGAEVTISTWQSIYKNAEIFENFDVLIIDEGHSAKAKSLKAIASYCCNAEFRIGMSGTYPDRNNREEKCDYMNVVGALGEPKQYTDYQEMEREGWIPKMVLTGIFLRYAQPVRRQIAEEIMSLKDKKKYKAELMEVDPEAAKDLPKVSDPYNYEIDRIHGLEQRNQFICNLIEKSCQGNTMVLFTKVEKHGKPLKALLENYFRGTKRVLYIDGDVKTGERNASRALAEANDDLIILASYGTFATGISIKNLHNVIFASGYKAKTKVLQAIGRGLRNLPGKEKVNIFDLVDDCRFSNKNFKFVNSSYKHFQKRAQIYEAKKFNWRTIVYKF